MLDQCTCMLLAMFMCLGLGFVCHAMCYCSPFVPFIAFSCVLAYWFGLDLDPIVFIIIHTPRPTLKDFDHPICTFMLVLASLVLGFAMLDTFCGLDFVWLHLTPIRPFGCDHLGGIFRCWVTLCDAMLTMYVHATCWLSMHLYTLAHISMHEF